MIDVAPLVGFVAELLPSRWLTTRPVWLRLLIIPLWLALACAITAAVISLAVVAWAFVKALAIGLAR
jgi:hypothetical protein